MHHGHAYFHTGEEARARRLRQAVIELLPEGSFVGGLREGPVGPHPQPMFEFHFPSGLLELVASGLEPVRAGHSILLHPVQEDEREAHTAGATWLGEPLELDLDRL